MVRVANIPFETDEKTVATLVPLVMFENDRFFFREVTGGLKVAQNDHWRVSLLGRLHFFDIPSQYQNMIQGDTIDWGLQVRYRPFQIAHLDFELLSDSEGHSSTNIRLGKELWRTDRWYLMTAAQAGYKTSHYNSYFWGLTREDVDAGVDWTVLANSYYHLWKSLYLQGAVVATYLSSPVRNSSLVNDDFDVEAYVGFGFSNDRSRPRKEDTGLRPYVRLAHGWATPTGLVNIWMFQAERDPDDNQLSTIFFGWPLTDELFGLPIDFYLHTGFGWHWKSATQKDIQEYVFSIKFSYTTPWAVRLRLGFAEGISWVTDVPSVESDNLTSKGYETSQYLNYLDSSVGLNLGDITPWDLDDWWLQYYVHHRSAIFETAQQFGRIKGGSNFQMVALEKFF